MQKLTTHNFFCAQTSTQTTIKQQPTPQLFHSIADLLKQGVGRNSPLIPPKRYLHLETPLEADPEAELMS